MANETGETSERSYGLTNIKAHIPVTLDLDDMNYSQWKKFVEMHCITNEAEGFLDGTNLPKAENDKAWIRKDTLVKMWIYNTISKPILQMVMKKSETAQQLWKAIQDLFQCNKDAKAIQLNDDLRSIEIGDLSISNYCHKLKVIFDLLDNMEQPIDERTLVMHTLNGLSHKYETIATVIRNQNPLPSFMDTCAKLQQEEARLNRNRNNSLNKDTSSSSTVLYAKSTNQPRPNSNQICRNYLRGNCRFAEKCRFIHGMGADQKRNNTQYPTGSFPRTGHYGPTPPTGFNNQPMYSQAHYPPFKPSAHYPSNHTYPYPPPTAPPANYTYPPPPAPYPTHHPYPNHATGPPAPPPVTPYPQNSAMLHTQSNDNTRNEFTTLPQAFTNMTFNDNGQGDWYMDTGATSHLTSQTGPLDQNKSS